MSYLRINVTVRPPEEIQKYVFRLSEQIANETEAYFILDGKNYYPHATIYSPEYPEQNKTLVLAKVEEIVSKLIAFEVNIEKLSTHMGYIDFELSKTIEWMNLHKQIVDGLNPMRENHIRSKYSDPDELIRLTQEQKDYIQKYGYPEVFNTYRPHITISRVKNGNLAEDIVKKLDFKPTTFIVKTITAFTMGTHGTCTGIIKEFKF